MPMATDNHHDLSPYELARLERIKRNETYLKSLGLIGKSTIKPSVPKKKIKRKAKESTQPRAPTRFSKRLRQTKEEVESKTENDIAIQEETPKEEEPLDYSRMPQEPDQLNDEEFQVFVALRAWRLRRKRELDIEAYKICQNRTLCELVRKRRNDNNFASNNVEKDLLTVWGIGPSKAKEGGYGWEMLEVLNKVENEQLLEKSRKDQGSTVSQRAVQS